MGLFDAFKKQVKEEEVKRNPLMDLLQSNGINIDNVTLSGTGGDVTLTGTAADGSIIERALELLNNAPGVTNVNNQVELADLSAQGIMYKVTTKGSNLNSRAGTSTDHDIIGKFANGTEVLLIQRTLADWSLVRGTGTEGQELEGQCHNDYLVQI